MIAMQNQLVVYPKFDPIFKNQYICDMTGKTNDIMAAKKPLIVKASMIVHTWIMTPSTKRAA